MASVLLRNTRPFIGLIQKFASVTSASFQSRTISLAACRCADRKFTEKHEWVAVEGNIGTIGITDYAQEALGDIVYAQLPEVGSEFNQMDECGALESVKAATELYCPVSGKVTVINKKVEDQPGLINRSPYAEGWLFKLELSSAEELNNLMNESGYQDFLKTQE